MKGSFEKCSIAFNIPPPVSKILSFSFTMVIAILNLFLLI